MGDRKQLNAGLSMLAVPQDGTVPRVTLQLIEGVWYGFQNKTDTFNGCLWAAR